MRIAIIGTGISGSLVARLLSTQHDVTVFEANNYPFSTTNYQQHDIGVMDRDAVRLLLIARTDRHTGIGSCYVYVQDADALHAELVDKGANVQCEPVDRPWGLREFGVLDPEGNRLTFGQPFE